MHPHGESASAGSLLSSGTSRGCCDAGEKKWVFGHWCPDAAPKVDADAHQALIYSSVGDRTQTPHLLCTFSSCLTSHGRGEDGLRGRRGVSEAALPSPARVGLGSATRTARVVGPHSPCLNQRHGEKCPWLVWLIESPVVVLVSSLGSNSASLCCLIS